MTLQLPDVEEGKVRKSSWLILIPVLFLLAAIGAPAGRADTVTLNVSGSLTPQTGTGASCSPSPCTLGGDIVIDNTTGALISVDITMADSSPTIGPFNIVSPIAYGPEVDGGQTELGIFDANGDVIGLVFATPTAGSLVGYISGALTGGPGGTAACIEDHGCGPTWLLTSGSLTPAAMPESSSVALLLIGLGSLGVMMVMRKRIAQGPYRPFESIVQNHFAGHH